MEKIIITTEETCNLNKELLDKYNIKKCDVNFWVNGIEHNSKTTDMTPKEFYEGMRQGNDVKTSQVNLQEALDFLEPYYKDGYKILHIGFSSGLSGTYNNFKLAMENLNKKYNAHNVAIDSLCASIGQGLLVVEVAKKLEQGVTYDELVQYAENLKWDINHIFTLDDLKYLVKGGRISKTSATIANVLNIKPVLHTDNNGKLVNIGKVFGRQLALKNLVEKMAINYKPEFKDVFICEADCHDDAIRLANMVEKKFNVKPVILPLTYFIGCHSGPGTISLFYVGNKRV